MMYNDAGSNWTDCPFFQTIRINDLKDGGLHPAPEMLQLNCEFFLRREGNHMAKYTVELSEEDLNMIKDCHSKNPSIMKAMNEAKKSEK